MNITVRKGSPEDLGAFIDLLYRVQQQMEHKDWFHLDSPEEFRRLMDNGAMHLWFAMDEDLVVGAFDILLPGLESFNYGYELQFTKEQLMRVVNMDSVAVHPDYRGLGIQRKLLQAAEGWMGEEERRILLCTIHPDNRYSLQNALKQGYQIQKQIPIYGSVRYLLKKEIKKREK